MAPLPLARNAAFSSCRRAGTKQACATRTHRQSGRGRLQVQARQGGLGDEDMDVAVFRFTLGIPGFEDRFVPQVVAGVGGALLALNHLVTAPPIPVSQGRAELLCGALVLVLAIIPEIEERLREAQPGRGRQTSAEAVAGSTNGFLLGSQLSDKQKQELAWASFALLKNTNSCGVVVHAGGKALMARGALGSGVVTPGQTDASLAAMSEDVAAVCSKSSELAGVLSGQTSQVFLPDRSAMNKAGLAACRSVPQGAESVLVQHVPASGEGRPSGVLLLVSERARALSDRERKWAAAMAQKLSAAL